MTREQVKDLLPFLQAFANGAPVQLLCGGEWRDMKGRIDIDPILQRYRVKPKESYRPFKNCEECWKEMLKHQPFGWVKMADEYDREYEKDDEDNIYLHVNYISDEDSESPNPIRINNESFKYSEVFESYIFADGIPFGIKELEEE